MAVALGLWSCVINAGGDPTLVEPAADIKITNIALGHELADPKGRTTVKLVYQPITADLSEDEDEDEDEEKEKPVDLATTVICSLTPDVNESRVVDIILQEENEYLFEVVGKNTVYLTGYYIDQRSADEPPYDDDSEFGSDISEDAYRLEDVSSDVEIDADGVESDASRFEEVDESASAAKKDNTKKRARDSDAMDVTDAPGSKADKKNKKLKAENGAAVSANAESVDEKKSKKDKKKDKKTDGAASETSSPAKAETKVLKGGLKVKDVKQGSGPEAKSGNTVEMRYVGKLQNGKVFDSNTKGKPFKFRLGAGEVIKGWDQGIVGMKVGGERLLTVPSEMAYGKKASGGIPANSTLIFECKLLKIV
ncbi:hypothetical protein HGRIS_002623 [Hohenbuehelia grisea]|uniref:FK506-binding protein n=1 Tax=Hohenbuehelia grisea TaxID=104357 RepID=A0ABR3JM95_9AGAR